MATNVTIDADAVSGAPIIGNIVTKTVITRFGIPAETSGGVDPADIAAAVEAYLTDNPVEGSGIENVVEDASPQLGGNLDLNGHTVGAATAGDLTKLHDAGTLSGNNTGNQDLSGYQPLDADLTALAALSAPATKLAGIEALADVTDTANVDAAGAVMNSDTSIAAMQFVIDEDDLAANSATKVPTQQSVKAYVDTAEQRLQPRKRVLELTNQATVAVDVDDYDAVYDIGITGAITLPNPTGTPDNLQQLWYSLTGTAARAITYGSAFEDSSIERPSTTDGTNRLDLGFVWNPASSKWRLVGYV
jgi:hypothetical protein